MTLPRKMGQLTIKTLFNKGRIMTDTKKDATTFTILMIDDDEEDFILVADALKSKQLTVELYWAENGDNAMDFLLRRGEYTDSPLPNLILLDLNMPKKDGFEVLMDLKAHPDLRKIPVVILTSSRDERQVARGYNVGASSFMLKPISFDEMADAMQSLCEYWFALVQLPGGQTGDPRKKVKKAV
jgi:CheY-like chemotaxis protein